MEDSVSLSEELTTVRDRAAGMWRVIPRRQKLTLFAAVLATVVGGAANTAVPLLIGGMIDRAQQGSSGGDGAFSLLASTPLHLVAGYLLLIGLAYVVRELLQVARRFLIEDTCTRLEKRLVVKLVSHLLMVDLSTLLHERLGTLHGRIFRSVGGAVRFLRVVFLDFLPALVIGGMALAAAVNKQPVLGLVMSAVIPVSLFLTIRQLISQRGVRLELMKDREEMDGTVVEQLSGIDYIRAANTHAQETRRITRAAEALRAREVRHHFVMSLYGSAKSLAEGLAHVGVLAVALYLALSGKISFGDIVTTSLLFLGVMAPLAEVHRMIDEGHESSLLVGDLLKMLREPRDRCYQSAGTEEPALEGTALLRLDNLHVHGSLSCGNAQRILSDISLEIHPGEIIGIAGRSGCGKSTLLRAVLRLVHPSGGAALLGGVPLHEVSRHSLAKLLGYVGQSPFVFSGTIAENIAYEQEDASPDDVQRAAESAGLHDEIMKIPQGYAARVEERGQNLSGGQRQRLALARVMLKDPPILILDEATSALDTISEARIQEWLATKRGHRTVLMVAHRISTLRQTDRIIVFDDGKVAEIGPYDALVAQGGLFCRLNESDQKVRTGV